MADAQATFQMTPDALWLMGFGLVPGLLACWLGTPAQSGRAGWLFGAACSLLGALGVFGVQHGGFFLLAWELMSLGGAVMILSERLADRPGGAGAVHARHARSRFGRPAGRGHDPGAAGAGPRLRGLRPRRRAGHGAGHDRRAAS